MQIQKYALALLVSATSLTSGFIFPSTKSSFGLGKSQSCSAIFSEVDNETAEPPIEAVPEAVTEAVPEAVTEAVPEAVTEAVPEAVTDESSTSDSVEDTSESEGDGSEETTSSADEAKVEAPTFTVYLSNLPYTTVRQDVDDMFAEFGKVNKVTLPKRKMDDGCRGFAFIDMENEGDMEKAILGVNEKQLGGRPLTAKKSVPKEELPSRQKRDRKTRATPERLYVGNLPYGVSEEEVKEMFKENAGGVEAKELFLVKDRDGKDRGFGFVTLDSEELVQPTIDLLDGFIFAGRRLAVRRPNPEGVKAKKGKDFNENTSRIYFGNLSFDTTTKTMRSLFEEHGQVLNLYVNEDFATKASRGYGFAQMPKEDALVAIEALNGLDIDGRDIKVCIAAEKMEKLRIYVGSLSFNTEEEGIRSVFGEYGEIYSVFLPEDSNYGGHRGFAILTMSVEDGHQAIKELNGIELDGRTIQVNIAQPKGSAKPVTKIYIGNLDFDTPEEALKDMFAEYGEVKSCILPEDKDFGGSRGFGFVQMDEDSAKAAMEGLDGADLDGRNIRVTLADGGRKNRRDDEFDQDDGYDNNDGYNDNGDDNNSDDNNGADDNGAADNGDDNNGDDF